MLATCFTIMGCASGTPVGPTAGLAGAGSVINNTVPADNPGWTVTNTGVNHIVGVMTATNPNINGAPLDSGDYIGVFYTDSNGVEHPGGYAIWQGKNTALAAWGNDITTKAKDGFAPGETFHWKIWKRSNGKTYSAVATYLPEDARGNRLDGGQWVENGISVLETLTGH